LGLSFDYDLQVERKKNECWALLHTMATPQLQVLLRKDDNNHCAMLYKHWYICMVLILRNKYLLRFSKPTNP
jgi:hypothetical protein